MTPYEAVRQEFTFPFELYPYQIDSVNELAPEPRTGFYHEPGAGKTASSTHLMLYHRLQFGVKQWIIVMPPILLPQWARWLRSITTKRTGKPLTALIYAGTPKKRAEMVLDADFILMSYDIMKRDQESIQHRLAEAVYGMTADEAHALKNIGSLTHKVFREYADGRNFTLLTGTPLTTPMDAYAYIRLICPTIYRNFRQFEQIHVEESDEYGKVTKYANLELLKQNMAVFTSRVLRRDVIKQLPPITYNTVVYDLDPSHHKLYERIALEKLVEFEDGREINAISTQALYSALQQVIVNWGYFEDDETKVPAVIDLIHEVFDELGPDAKLAVVGNFIRTNAYLLKTLAKYNAVAVYGEVSAANKQKAITRFIEDPSCRCIILQPRSAGFGVDGLQTVCSDMLIVEAPTIAPPFYQVAARLDRDGQTKPVNCRIAVASRTVQVRMFRNLLANDATINAVQGGYKDLKEAINGD